MTVTDKVIVRLGRQERIDRSVIMEKVNNRD